MVFILRWRFCHFILRCGYVPLILGPSLQRVVVPLLVRGDGALVVVRQAEAVALQGNKEEANLMAG